MKKWEYRYIIKQITTGGENGAANFDELQKAGAEGWEVISDEKDHWLLKREIWLLKREITQ